MTVIISESCKNKPPTVWKTHPLQLSATQAKTIELSAIIPFLKKAENSPSALAGINPKKIASPVITRLDANCRKAATEYKLHLEKSETDDREIIDSFRDVKIWEKTYFAWFQWFWGTEFVNQADFERDTQAHRYAALIKISILEEIRLQALRTELTHAITAEIDHLLNLEKINQTDSKAQDKLWQLKRVYDVYFKEQPHEKQIHIQRLLPSEDVMEAKFLTGPASNVQLIK